MKKVCLIMVMVLLTVSLTACGTGGLLDLPGGSGLNKNEFINEQNFAYDLNSVSVKPRHVWWENGSLVAECFVTNGFSHTVYDVEVKSLSLANNQGLIAEAAFGSLQGVTIAPYSYVIWAFRFAPEHVSASGAELSELICRSSTSNRY